MNTSDAIKTTIDNVLRTSAQLGYGAPSLPSTEGKWTNTRGARLPPLSDWIVDSDKFDDAIATAYTKVQPGTMRKLIAPTGRGKSTYMPGKIASLNSVSAMVLVPEDKHVAHLYTYLVNWFPNAGLSVEPRPLKTAYAVDPPDGNIVYYCTGAKLLSVFSRYPDLFDTLRVDFVIVDEYHKIMPANLALYQLAKVRPELSNLRMLAATATGPSDITTKVKKFDLRIEKLSPADVNIDNPLVNTIRNPMHYSRITDKVMIFLPDDESVSIWQAYYENFDVPAIACGFISGSEHEAAIHAFLAANPLCVLLTTQVLETTFTFDVDVVVDTGYYICAQGNYQDMKVSLKKCPVTKSMREQRRGRVGRFKAGTAYYVDRPLSDDITESDPDVCFVVYLWMIVFNLTLNDPMYAVYKGMGEVTALKAALLLHSRIHPLLMFPYIANDGFLKGWENTMKYALYTDVNIVSQADNLEAVETRWTLYKARDLPFSEVAIEFKARVKFPEQWEALPAMAYQVFVGADENGVVSTFKSQSIATALKVSDQKRRSAFDPARFNLDGGAKPGGFNIADEMPKLGHTGGSGNADDLNRKRKKHHRQTSMTMLNDVLPAMTDQMKVINVGAEKMPATGVATIDMWAKALPSVAEFEPLDVEPVVVVSPGKRGSHSATVFSDSSEKYNSLSLITIDPTAAASKYLTFYPASKDLFKMYIKSRVGVTRTDSIRVRSMANGTEPIAIMNEHKAIKYFFSAIRVHNSTASQFLQLVARTTKLDLFDKIMRLNTEDDKRTAKDLVNQSCGLLRVFVNRHMLVAVDQRCMKSDMDGVSDSNNEELLEAYANTPTYAEARRMAEFSLEWGNQTCRDRVQQYHDHIVHHKLLGYLISNMWHFGDYVIGVRHAFLAADTVSLDLADLPGVAGSLEVDMSSLDIIVLRSQFAREVPYVRKPVSTEDALVMFWSTVEEKIVVAGGLKLLVEGDDCFLSDNFHKGSSGALIVSAYDGAVFGFYTSQAEAVGNVSLAVNVFSTLI